MVVKIRFGKGPVVTRRQGKNGRIAMLSASMLTLVSICFGSLAAWRVTEDVDLTGDFVFREGLSFSLAGVDGCRCRHAVQCLAPDPIRTAVAHSTHRGGSRSRGGATVARRC